VNYKSWEFDPVMEPAIRRLVEHDHYEERPFHMDDGRP
jgi:hypothetical protein